MNQIKKNCHLTAYLRPCLTIEMAQFVNHYSTPLKRGYMRHKMPILSRILAVFSSVLAQIWFSFGSDLVQILDHFWFSSGSVLN